MRAEQIKKSLRVGTIVYCFHSISNEPAMLIPIGESYVLYERDLANHHWIQMAQGASIDSLSENQFTVIYHNESEAITAFKVK